MIFTMTEVPSARLFASENIEWNETMSETWKHPAKLRKAKTYQAICCSTLYARCPTVILAALLAWYLEDEDLQPRLPPQSSLVHSESIGKQSQVPSFSTKVSTCKRCVNKQQFQKIQKHLKKMLRSPSVWRKGWGKDQTCALCLCVCVRVCVCMFVPSVLSVTCTLSLPDSFLFTSDWEANKLPC